MIRKSKSRRIFEVFNYTFFIVFSLSVLVPFINALAISLSSIEAITLGKIGLWPIGLTVESYYKLAYNLQFLRTFRNSVFLTTVNTTLVITIALAAGYALANKYLVGKKIVFAYFLVTMYFGGGLIPTYLLINSLKIANSTENYKSSNCWDYEWNYYIK